MGRLEDCARLLSNRYPKESCGAGCGEGLFAPVFGLNGDVSPDRVWFSWPHCPEFALATVLNRIGTC